MILTLYNDKFFDGLGKQVGLDVGDVLQVRMIEDNTFTYYKEAEPAPSQNELNGATVHQQPQGEICSWEWIKNDVGGFYHTSCGEKVQSLLEIDGFKFCLFCGRKLSPVR